MNQKNNLLRPVNYEKVKKGSVAGIVACVIWMILGLLFLAVAAFYFIDAKMEEGKSQSQTEEFDPYQRYSLENSWKTVSVIGISYEFAEDFKGANKYYMAFTESGDFVIVKRKGDLPEEYQPLLDYMFSDDSSMPEAMELRGVSVPIDDDIREYAIEALNELFGEEYVTEEIFDTYVGQNFLDMTKKPAGNADYGVVLPMFVMGAFFCVGALLCLVMFAKRRNHAIAEIKKEKGRMLQAQMYRNEESEAGEEYAAATVIAGDFKHFQGTSQPDTDTLEGLIKENAPQKANFFLGLIGALAGSLLGAALWIAIGFTGFIAGIAGFAMLKFALIGYQKLGGRLDKKGAVLCLLIAAAMIPTANVLECVIAFCRVFFEYDAGVDTIQYVVMNFGELMTDSEMWPDFWKNLVIGYGLSIWASYGLIGSILSYKEPER